MACGWHEFLHKLPANYGVERNGCFPPLFYAKITTNIPLFAK